MWKVHGSDGLKLVSCDTKSVYHMHEHKTRSRRKLYIDLLLFF